MKRIHLNNYIILNHVKSFRIATIKEFDSCYNYCCLQYIKASTLAIKQLKLGTIITKFSFIPCQPNSRELNYRFLLTLCNPPSITCPRILKTLFNVE